MKDVQGMDTIDNGFNIYCYSTICSYINMASHYHKFISIVLVKNNARELVKCESLKTLFYFLGKHIYIYFQYFLPKVDFPLSVIFYIFLLSSFFLITLITIRQPKVYNNII